MYLNLTEWASQALHIKHQGNVFNNFNPTARETVAKKFADK